MYQKGFLSLIKLKAFEPGVSTAGIECEQIKYINFLINN